MTAENHPLIAWKTILPLQSACTVLHIVALYISHIFMLVKRNIMYMLEIYNVDVWCVGPDLVKTW